jgi:hypothetical protein
MVVFGHSHSGLNHILDRATMVGVMPILERALGCDDWVSARLGPSEAADLAVA